MKSFYFYCKPRSERLELVMRSPKIADPVAPLRRGLAPDFCPRITFGSPEKLTPDSRLAENHF